MLIRGLSSISLAVARGDLSFHNFLYPAPADARRLLSFFVERLPKRGTGGAGSEEAAKATDGGAAATRAALRAWMRQGPQPAEAAESRHRPVPFRADSVALGAGDAPLREQLASAARAVPSLLAAAATGAARDADAAERRLRGLAGGEAAAEAAAARELARAAVAAAAATPPTRLQEASAVTQSGAPSASSSLFALEAAFAEELAPAGGKRRRGGASAGTSAAEEAPQPATESAEERRARLAAERAAALAEATEALEATLRATELLEAKANASTTAAAAADADAEAARGANAGLKAELELVRRTAGLILSGERSVEENEAELERRVGALAGKLERLRGEWASHAAPLQARRDRLAAAGAAAEAQAAGALADARALAAELPSLQASLRAKEAEHARLVKAAEAHAQGAAGQRRRTEFVRRIGEVVGNVKRQQAGIRAIAADVRQARRDLNAAEEALKRAHREVDDLIFRDARGDAESAQAYRLLNEAHDAFARVATAVQGAAREAGKAGELRRRAEALATERPADADRVAGDLEAMRTANHEAEQKLAAAGMAAVR